MLYRVSGKTNDVERPTFVSRIEAGTPFGAVATFQKGLVDAGGSEDMISEIRVRKAKSGSSIRFGKKADPNAPKRGRKPGTATAAVAAPVAAPAAAPVKNGGKK